MTLEEFLKKNYHPENGSLTYDQGGNFEDSFYAGEERGYAQALFDVSKSQGIELPPLYEQEFD